MYTPKKLKWDSLSEFKKFLERDTSEKILEFSGYKLITETTEYGLLDSRLIISPKKEKVKEEPKQVVVKPKPVKEVKSTKKKTVKEVKSTKKKTVKEVKTANR
jgi:hypothetical protein